MFDSGAVFIDNWIEAGRRVADLIRLRAITRQMGDRDSCLAAVKECPGLYRDLTDQRSYAYVVPVQLPYRVLGPVADLPNVRVLQRALLGIASQCGRIDLLHGHFYADARPLPTVRRRLGLPYVVTEHSSALSRASPDQSISRAGLRVARRVYGDAAYVLPVSHYLAEAIQRLGLRGRFVVIDNPVDESAFDQAAPYRGGRFRVVCIARLDLVKAVDVLIRAAERLVAAGLDLELTVFGEGSQRGALMSLARQLGVAERVALPGFRPRAEIYGALAQAHAFSLPSHVEGQPFAVIEALCTGLPVVATAVGGVPEIVGREDGLLVPPTDVDGLSDALMQVARAPARFNGADIAARARARFSYETVGARLSRLYSAVAGHSDR
jgi:glycosyltransferase involved in cell wall biosynthesis